MKNNLFQHVKYSISTTNPSLPCRSGPHRPLHFGNAMCRRTRPKCDSYQLHGRASPTNHLQQRQNVPRFYQVAGYPLQVPAQTVEPIDRLRDENRKCVNLTKITCLERIVGLHLGADNRDVFTLRCDHVGERDNADVDIIFACGVTRRFDLEGWDNDLTRFVALGLVDPMVQETNAAYNLQFRKNTQHIALKYLLGFGFAISRLLYPKVRQDSFIYLLASVKFFWRKVARITDDVRCSGNLVTSADTNDLTRRIGKKFINWLVQHEGAAKHSAQSACDER